MISKAFVLDATKPVIETMAFSSDPGADHLYTVDDVITLTITLSEKVFITKGDNNEVPQIALLIGNVSKYASYVAANGDDLGTTSLHFSYKVVAGDLDVDGISVSAGEIVLPGGASIADHAGNAATVTYPQIPNDPNHAVVTEVGAQVLSFENGDTGVSGSDGIVGFSAGVQGALMRLDLPTVEVEAIWRYSINGGDWVDGPAFTGASQFGNFTLAQGTYGAGTIRTQVVDAAGNMSVVVSNTQDITVDGAAPAILSQTTGYINPAADLTLTFNEKVVLGNSGTMSLYQTVGGVATLVQTIDLAISKVGLSLSTDGHALSFNPVADLVKGTDYYITVSAGAIKDLASNNLPAIGVNDWAFSAADPSTSISFTSGGLYKGLYLSGTMHQDSNLLLEGVISDATGKFDTSTAITSITLHPADNSGDIVLNAPAVTWDATFSHWSIAASTFTGASGFSDNTQYTITVDLINPSGGGTGKGSITMATDFVVNTPTLAIADVGELTNDGLTSKDIVTVGNLELGATWQYTVDGTTWKTGSGTSFVLPQGTYEANKIAVKQTDKAGNIASESIASALIIDTTAPTIVSTVISSSAGTDHYYSLGDQITFTVTMSDVAYLNTAAGTPAINFTIGATTKSATYVSGSGTASLIFAYTVASGDTDANGIALPAGSIGLNAGTIKDKAGNLAVTSYNLIADSTSHMVDSTVAAPATIALATDSGLSSSDGITNTKIFNITGLEVATATAGISGFNHLEYQVDGTTGAWTTVATASTSFTLGTAVANGSHTVYVREIDTAGNTSTATSKAFTLDTTALAPTLSIATDTGAYANDGSTKIGIFTISGLEASSATSSGLAQAMYQIDSAAGAWTTLAAGVTSFTLGTAVADGSHMAYVREIDVAGNTSSITSKFILLDTTIATPTVALATDSGLSS
ncbi:MAG: beta strand repeat-containing protein, partial [Candidatus Nanopelagicales bacterium]